MSTVQLYTGAQINFGDLTPYLTYGDPDPVGSASVDPVPFQPNFNLLYRYCKKNLKYLACYL
jgi:hypothetical protein